jgi:Tol biopolymer transport system component
MPRPGHRAPDYLDDILTTTARSSSSSMPRPGHRAPDYLDDILTTTARTRQRPAWTSIERLLPMDITARRAGLRQPIPWRAFSVLVVLAALLAALLAYAVATQRALPPPYGLARNGELLASGDGDIFRVDPVTAKRTTLVGGSTFDFGPGFSRDGPKFLLLREAPKPCGKSDCGLILAIANADGSGVRELTPGLPALDWADWSPYGSSIALLTAATSGIGHDLEIVPLDGSPIRRLDLGQPVLEVSWLPPTGQELVFRPDWQADPTAERGVFAVRADGSGRRRIPTPRIGPDRDYRGIAVSPDGALLTHQDTGAKAFRIHIVDLRTGADRLLPQPPGTAQLGAGFSPDGRSVMYLRWGTADRFRMVVAPVDGSSTGIELGPSAPFGDDGPTINNYGWSPDGTAVFANYDADKTARLLPIDGSKPIELLTGELALPAYQRLAPR